MASSINLWAAGSAPLLESMKKAATALRQAGVRFALAGGGAAYARGAAPPVHDIDFVLAQPDVGTATEALAASGMTIEYPPEGWLVKAFDGGQMIDLIHCLGGVPVTGDLLDGAEELEVAAIRLPVLGATDVVQVRVLRPDTGIVQSGRDRMRLDRLPVGVLQQVRPRTM